MVPTPSPGASRSFFARRFFPAPADAAAAARLEVRPDAMSCNVPMAHRTSPCDAAAISASLAGATSIPSARATAASAFANFACVAGLNASTSAPAASIAGESRRDDNT